jgi:hypothetical protein
MTLLSKSKYLIGLQCPKYFWTSIHRKDKLPEVDEETQYLFDQGHIVGGLAKKLFPDGIDIPDEDFTSNLNKSTELLKLKKTLFEVAICTDYLYSRADILVPVGDEWDIVEVKSSTKVKDVNIHDLSFQKFVYEKSGLKIRKCFLMHINNQFVKNGEINPEEFFTKVDVTKEVNDIESVKERIDAMLALMKSDVCPDIKIGTQCADPYACPLADECWGFLPSASVFDLYRGGKKSFELFEDGVQAIIDIPDDYKLSDKQGIQHKCEKDGSIHIDKEGIKAFLDTLKGKLYYLDFETYNTAVPLFDGVKPYQQIPFQWSLHVDSEHFEFLASGSGDPREEFLKSLKKVLGDGTIITYNQSFEIGRLREMAAAYPAYKDWVEEVVTRVVDLIVPFRQFHYYNPKQKGSCSLKKVLPAITGKGYDGLDIAGGGQASVLYFRSVFGKVSDSEREKIREDLLKYCSLDTEGMVWVVRELGKISTSSN